MGIKNMEYLITAKDAMQKYGIREQQILDIVNSGKVILYGRMGEVLNADSEKELREFEYHASFESAKREEQELALQMYDIDLPLDEFDAEPLLLSKITETAKNYVRLFVVHRYSFNTKEFEDALLEMLSNLTHEDATSTPSPPRAKRPEKAALWEKALEEELNDFSYDDKKSIDVFKRQVTDFINITIKKTTSQYKLSPAGGGNRGNISRDMTEVEKMIVPFMMKKYPNLPSPYD